MRFENSLLPGVKIITLDPVTDSRGYFCRAFDRELFAAAGLQFDWVQENVAHNASKHTLRGFHFQEGEHWESKIFSVDCGSVLLVLLDLRKDLVTFGRTAALTLTADPRRLIFVPVGLAVAYCTLQDQTVVRYKVDRRYAPEFARGIAWNDPDLGVQWPVSNPVLSEKDAKNPTLRQWAGM